MLTWMLRTWWVQLLFGVVGALGLASSDHSGQPPLATAFGVVITGMFFFSAGQLWATRAAPPSRTEPIELRASGRAPRPR